MVVQMKLTLVTVIGVVVQLGMLDLHRERLERRESVGSRTWPVCGWRLAGPGSVSPL